jgi:hypothetical protein
MARWPAVVSVRCRQVPLLSVKVPSLFFREMVRRYMPMKLAAHTFGYTPNIHPQTCAYEFLPVDPAFSPSLNSKCHLQTAQRPPQLRNPGPCRCPLLVPIRMTPEVGAGDNPRHDCGPMIGTTIRRLSCPSLPG